MFFCRAEKVCQMWKEVSGHPNLWGKVDMSPYDWKKTSETKLKSFCRKRLRQCKELNISGCHFMNHSWGVNVSNLTVCNNNIILLIQFIYVHSFRRTVCIVIIFYQIC